MSKEEKAALKNEATAFVRGIVTEVYGQRASKKTVSVAAKRFVETILPAKLANQHARAEEAR